MSARYQFHPRVHEEWADQALYFLLAGFRARYDPRDLAAALLRVFEEHEVSAQTTYELVGSFDLMVRLWLSPRRLRAFRASLGSELAPLSLANDVVVPVSAVVLQWPWNDQGAGQIVRGEIAAPSGDLPQMPSASVIRQLNRLTSSDDTDVDQSVIAEWTARNVIAYAAPDSQPGVTMVTLIRAASELSANELNSLERHIARTLDSADPSIYSECALYRTESRDQPFLLMFRALADGFVSVRDLLSELAEPLLDRARTTTYPVIREGLVPLTDGVAPVSRREHMGLSDLLSEDESDSLEVSASAFAPVDAWLLKGEPLIEQKGLFDRTVLKSVVAFLNGSGGTVVIGATEAARYRGADIAVDERLADFPVVGQYACLGLIDPTYTEEGWDVYSRRILEILDTRITWTPVATGAVKVEKSTYKDREFCLVRVEGRTEDRWYYSLANERAPQFFVRSGARVVELIGPQADTYKAKRRRPDLEPSTSS